MSDPLPTPLLRHSVVVYEHDDNGQPVPLCAFEFTEGSRTIVRGADQCSTVAPLLVAAAQKAFAGYVLAEVTKGGGE